MTSSWSFIRQSHISVAAPATWSSAKSAYRNTHFTLCHLHNYVSLQEHRPVTYLLLCSQVAVGRSCDLHAKREMPAELWCEPLRKRLLWRTKRIWILEETLLGWGVNGIGSMSFPTKSLGFSGDVTVQLEVEWNCWLQDWGRLSIYRNLLKSKP